MNFDISNNQILATTPAASDYASLSGNEIILASDHLPNENITVIIGNTSATPVTLRDEHRVRRRGAQLARHIFFADKKSGRPHSEQTA